MVQIKVNEEGKTEGQIKENSEGPPDKQIEALDKVETQGKKEIPLEDMKKAELLERAREFQKTTEENYDLYLRSQAEIENLKKRFQKEKDDLIKYANESLIKQLLTVIDNLEKAISSSQNENSLDAVREGVELTLKGFTDILEKAGLERIESEGKPFDPNFHQAISEMENNNVETGTVLKELQKGYTLNERLIRPAMVVVSKNNS